MHRVARTGRGLTGLKGSQVTGPWITDIRHFLDGQARVPDDLPVVPRYMGAIVAAASPLHASTDRETGEISWFCPCCGDHGRIYGWQGSPWDRRAARSTPTACSAGRPAGFSPRATAAWNAIPQEIRARLLDNFWCGVCRRSASVELCSGSVSRGDLVLRGYCTRCGSEIARLVEIVGRT